MNTLSRLFPLLLCISAAPQLPQMADIQDKSVSRAVSTPKALLLAHAEDDDPLLRALALQGLIQHSPKAWAPVGLFDAAPWVQRRAAQTLSQSRRGLIEASHFLAAMPNPYAQLLLVQALSNAQMAIPPIKQPANVPRWDRGVHALIQWLSGDQAALPRLLSAVSAGEAPYEPSYFVALGATRSSEALKALTIGQERAEPEMTPLYLGARLALGDKRALRSVAQIFTSSDRDLQLGLLEELSVFGPSVSRPVAKKLKRSRELRPFAQIELGKHRALFASQRSVEVQRAALFQLVRLVKTQAIDAAEAAPFFREAMTSDDLSSREAAIEGLVLSSPPDLPFIQSALMDESDAVSLIAAAHLLSLSSETHP